MIVTLNEMKKYLRVDFTDDNNLIKSLIETSEQMCEEILRVDSIEDYSENENVRVAVMYTVAYLYEHREEASHNELKLTLRAMLSSFRGEAF